MNHALLCMNGADSRFCLLTQRTWSSRWLQHLLRWPRELNALKLQKTHPNRKSTSKSRKHFHHVDSIWYKCSQTNKETCCKCSQHNQIHFICSAFLFWLCCEHLQRVRCQIDESVFLICRCLKLQRVELLPFQRGHEYMNNISRNDLKVTSRAFDRFTWVKLVSYHTHRTLKVCTANHQK